MDDLQTAWLMIGWLLAFWAGKDLQSRFAQRQKAGQRVKAEPER